MAVIQSSWISLRLWQVAIGNLYFSHLAGDTCWSETDGLRVVAKGTSRLVETSPENTLEKSPKNTSRRQQRTRFQEHHMGLP